MLLQRIFKKATIRSRAKAEEHAALVVKVWLNGDLTLAHPDIAEPVTLPPFGIVRCKDQRLAAHEFLKRKCPALNPIPDNDSKLTR